MKLINNHQELIEMIKSTLLIVIIITSMLTGHVAITTRAESPEKSPQVWKDPNKPADERIADLISRMTVEEKVSQLMNGSVAIDRLGIPTYDWWSEALHGVARSGRATVFPQAIGIGATFDEDLVLRIATAISDEARAKYNIAQQIGNRGRYAGLSFWSPNVNIFRDPRWGRGQETYGEDPYLTSHLGVAFVKGMQGDNPRYLKTAACAKHFAVHSGPEALRHEFNAAPPKKDFFETYLPAFKALVQEANVEAVMCAYNRVYDDPCCGSNLLLQTILRKNWGFKGHILSDCWAIHDFNGGHKVTSNVVESAARALNSGVNLNCGDEYSNLLEAYKKGLVTEKQIDENLSMLLRTRFKLGLFDPPGSVPYENIGPEVIGSPKNRQLAREAAIKSIVMLKNKSVLPLKKNIKKLYVLGPYATNQEILLGNYYGISENLTTILEGIAGKVSPGTTIEYKMGTLADRENANPIDWTTGEAHGSDAIVAVFGISGLLEGEEGESIASPTKGDRLQLGIPEGQLNYLKKLRAAGSKPIILVLTGGSPICTPELEELADAILFVWYPGQEGGSAVADIIFGDANPSGRLPITFPKSETQLPPFDDYAMTGRTYRYMTEKPLFPFGFGLSYTTFKYSDLKLSNKLISKGESINVEATIRNGGKFSGDEVVQLYLSDLKASVRVPLFSLKGIKRVSLKPGEATTVSFTIKPEDMMLVDNDGNSILEAGAFKIYVGAAAPLDRSRDLGTIKPLEATFTVK